MGRSMGPDRSARPRVPQRPRAPRIALFGNFGVGNAGNDGSLDALLQFLRRARPDAALSCVCSQPEAVEARFGLPALPIVPPGRKPGARSGGFAKIGRIPRRGATILGTFRQARAYDAMIVAGTGILDDGGEVPTAMPLNLLTWCLAARTAGAEIAFVSVGAGPINNPINRALMKRATLLGQYRSFRDAVSRDYMRLIGAGRPGDRVYPDVAFGLPVPSVPPRRHPGPGEQLVVGLGVMSYRGWFGFGADGDAMLKRHVGRMTDVAVHLLRSGHGLRLLVGETIDEIAVEMLTAQLAQAVPSELAARVVYVPQRTLADVMVEMAQTDLVIATRFHNLVCAMKTGRPAIALGYGPKDEALMQDMGLGAFRSHVETFDPAWLASRFAALAADRDRLAAEIDRRVALAEARLREQEEALLGWLHGVCGRRQAAPVVAMAAE